MKSEEAENNEEIKKSQDGPERKDSQEKLHEGTNKIESEGHPLEVNANLNQQEVHEQRVGEEVGDAQQPRLVVKEITYSKGLSEDSQEQNNIKYMTLKKRDSQDEVDSLPQDETPQDEQPKEKIEDEDHEKPQEPQLKAETEAKFVEPKLRDEEEQQQQMHSEHNEEEVDRDREAEEEGENREVIQVQENEIHDNEGGDVEKKETTKGEESVEGHVNEEDNLQGKEEVHQIDHDYEEHQQEEVGGDHVEEGDFIERSKNEDNAEGEEEHIEGEEEHLEGEDEHVEGEEHAGEEQVEGEGEGEGEEEGDEEREREGEEAELEGEEQMEGDEQMEEQMQEEEGEQENEEGNEHISNDGQANQGNWNRPQVSSVEEISGQNLNFHNLNQVMGNINANINTNINNMQNVVNQVTSQGGMGGMFKQTNIVKTQITKDNGNIVNYQREQKIIRETPDQTQVRTQTQTQMPQQNVNYGAVISEYPQQYATHEIDNFVNNQRNIMSNAVNQNQNDLRTNIGNRHIQSYGQFEQNIDPMMYSFGPNSRASGGQNATPSSGNQNIANSSDFLMSSMKNNGNMNMNANVGLQQSEFTLLQNNDLGLNNNIDNIMNQNGGYYMSSVSNNVRVVSGPTQMVNDMGRITTTNYQSEINNNLPYIQATSPSQESGSRREPTDGDSKKKKNEEDMKHEEISDFPLEPRDSRRKN